MARFPKHHYSRIWPRPCALITLLYADGAAHRELVNGVTVNTEAAALKLVARFVSYDGVGLIGAAVGDTATGDAWFWTILDLPDGIAREPIEHVEKRFRHRLSEAEKQRAVRRALKNA